MSSTDGPLVVDFRSDTVTRPSAAMREVIASAEVGDNVFGDCPTVERLEALAAEITGKEAALYVPSGKIAQTLGLLLEKMILSKGTMGNLVAMLSHCWGRGFEALMGDQSHVHLDEQGGMAQVCGIITETCHGF